MRVAVRLVPLAAYVARASRLGMALATMRVVIMVVVAAAAAVGGGAAIMVGV